LAFPDQDSPTAKALLKRFTSRDRGKLIRAASEVAETGERQELVLETRSRAPCGQRIIETTLRRGNNFEGEPVVYAAFHDITEATRAKQQLETLAFTDSLTGIGNRAEFFRTGERMVQSLDRNSDRTLSLILIDLDGFKPINDTHGHGVGDRVLSQVAKRLVAMVRAGDLVTRLGGDEFAILLEHEAGNGRANRIADLCLEALRLPILIEGLDLRISASIGVRLEISEGESIEVALAYADKAMYRVKANGRNGIDVERDRRALGGRMSA
jgi:diguanylate cyclase (GGDEF)-like protein